MPEDTMDKDLSRSKVKICCKKFEENAENRGGYCTPSIQVCSFPPYIQACDNTLEEAPLEFCPWCGKKFEAIQ